MTLKHIDFYDSPVMIELAKNAIKKGSVKPSVSDVIGRVASTRKYAATGDLFVDLIKLADGLRERGLVSDAIALEGKIVDYKRASIMDEAHPEGDVEIAKAEGGHGVVETKPTEHKMLEEIVRRNPTGKMASLTQSILKMAESVLVKEADENNGKMWSDDENKKLKPEEKEAKAVEFLSQKIPEYFSQNYQILSTVLVNPNVINFSYDTVVGDPNVRSAYCKIVKVDSKLINSAAQTIQSIYNTGVGTPDQIFSGEYLKKIKEFTSKNNIKAVYTALGINYTIDENNLKQEAEKLANTANNAVSQILNRSKLNKVAEINARLVDKATKFSESYSAAIQILGDPPDINSIQSAQDALLKLSSAQSILNKANVTDNELTFIVDTFNGLNYREAKTAIIKAIGNISGQIRYVNNAITMANKAYSIIDSDDARTNIINASKQLQSYIDNDDIKFDKKRLQSIKSVLDEFANNLVVGKKYSDVVEDASKLFTNAKSYYELVQETVGLKSFFERMVGIPTVTPGEPAPPADDSASVSVKQQQKKNSLKNINIKLAEPTGILGGSTSATPPNSGSKGAGTSGQRQGQSVPGKGTPLGSESDSPRKEVLEMQQAMKAKDPLLTSNIGSKENPNMPDGVWGTKTKEAIDAINARYKLGLHTGPMWVQPGGKGYHLPNTDKFAKENTEKLGGKTGEKQVKSEVYDSIDPEKVRFGQILCQGDVPVRSEYFGSLLAFRDFIVNDIWSRVSAGTVMTYNSGMSHLNFFKTRAEKLLSEQKKAQPNNDQKQANEQKIEMLERYRAAAYNLMSKLRAVYDRMSPQNPDAPIPTSLLSSGNNVPTGAQKPQHRPGSTPGGTDGPDGVDVDKYNKKGTGDESKNPVQRILRLNSPYFTSEYGNNIPYIFRVGELDLTQFEAYGYDELMHIIRPVREDSGENVDTARLLQELQKKYGLPAVAPTQMAGFYPTEGRRGLWYQGDDGNIYVATTDGKWSEISKSNDENIKKIYENARNTETTYDLKSFLISLREKLPTAFNLWADAQGFEGETRVKHGAMVFPWVSAIKKKLADINNQRSGRSGRSGYRP